MPTKAPSVCICGRVKPAGHQCACTADRRRAAEKRRLSARQRGYTTEWENARRDWLERNPYCAWTDERGQCGRLASVVDHKQPHRGDMVKFWDRANWQSLCVSCHSARKQRLEARQLRCEA